MLVKAFLNTPVYCDGKDPPHPPFHAIWHKGWCCAHDIPSVRRGYEVYRQVCSTCHSMKFRSFRQLVNQVEDAFPAHTTSCTPRLTKGSHGQHFPHGSHAGCHLTFTTRRFHPPPQVYPEARVKQIAASYDMWDGPNEEGEMFQRPGILTDTFPLPYPNNEAAAYSNGGAIPPDLSIFTAARHEGVDYLFSMLTSYRDPPYGIHLRAGLYYNSYFPGIVCS